MHLCDDTPEYMGSWLRDIGRTVGTVAKGATHIGLNYARNTGILPHDAGGNDSGGQPIVIQSGFDLKGALPYLALGGAALLFLFRKK